MKEVVYVSTFRIRYREMSSGKQRNGRVQTNNLKLYLQQKTPRASNIPMIVVNSRLKQRIQCKTITLTDKEFQPN